jgi:potassium channel subfamily K, other eukaryote
MISCGISMTLCTVTIGTIARDDISWPSAASCAVPLDIFCCCRLPRGMFTQRFFLGAVSAIVLLARTSCAFSGWRDSSQHHLVNAAPKKIHSPSFQTKPAQRQGFVLHSTAPDSRRASFNGPFRRNVLQRVAHNFTHFLWTGMMLPFPMLRGLAKESTDTGFTLAESFMAMGAYLGAGVLAYSVVLEKWSVVNACYFSVVSWSTVGYGDLGPSTPASKLFTCIYGLGGVCLLGAAISSLGSRLVNAEIEAIKGAERASRRRLLKVLDAMPGGVVPNKQQLDQEESGQPNRKESTNAPWWTKKLLQTAQSLIPAFTVLITGGLIMGRLEGWHWTDALYFSVITAGTLGFGDFSPRTRAGRIWAIPFIPFAVAAAGEVIGNIASFLSERRAKQVYDRILHRELTMDYLLQMDANGDGKVTREEFTYGMLVELKIVDADQLEQLNQQFDRLDITKSGTLEKEDLKLAAELNLIREFSEGNY